jgi:hypothetical protein
LVELHKPWGTLPRDPTESVPSSEGRSIRNFWKIVLLKTCMVGKEKYNSVKQ